MDTHITAFAEHATRLDRLQYFQLACDGFYRAAKASTETLELNYRIAGRNVRLRMAGRAMAPYICRTLEHLRVNGSILPPDLTICMWDSTSTDTPLPLLIASHLAYVRHHRWQLIDSRFQIAGLYARRIRSTFHNGPDILTVLDMQENLAVYWTPDATRIPYYESSYPFKRILSPWFHDQGLQYVHAAAVGHVSGGILLPGRGGVGKSTTALACIGSAVGFLGDDYCLIQVTPHPHAFSLYNAAKLKTLDDVKRFSHLIPMIMNLERVGEEMAMIYTHAHWPEQVIGDFPLRAIMVPNISEHRDTKISEIPRSAALKALLPTLEQLPGAGKETFQAFSALSKRLPCYRLELGSDISRIPGVIHNFLTA